MSSAKKKKGTIGTRKKKSDDHLGWFRCEKISSSDGEQANICLMADINDKVEVKSYSKPNTSCCSSSDDEEDMPYDVLL